MDTGLTRIGERGCNSRKESSGNELRMHRDALSPQHVQLWSSRRAWNEDSASCSPILRQRERKKRKRDPNAHPMSRAAKRGRRDPNMSSVDDVQRQILLIIRSVRQETQ
jgi:hypothetical protein